MRRLTIGSFLATVAGALTILSLLLLSQGADDARAQTPIIFTAVDVNPAGNTGEIAGPIDSATGNVPLNTPLVVDVTADGVPPGPIDGDGGGIFGAGFEFTFDPAFIQVTASAGGVNNVMPLCARPPVANCASEPAGAWTATSLEVFDATPDTDGSHRVDIVDLSGNEESGGGRLAAITIECVATSPPTGTPLGLTDTSTGGGNEAGLLGDSGAIVYDPANEFEAVIYCNVDPPVAADVKATAATTNAPAGPIAAGTPFNVSVSGTVHNNGPTSPVNSDVTVTLNTPADCGPSQSVVVQNLSLATSVATNVPPQNFTVTCTGPSFHDFTGTVSVQPDQAGVVDNIQANNSMTSAVDTTIITASADFGITGASGDTNLPPQCLPQSPPAPACATADTGIVGQSFQVTVTKTLHNNGPFGPVPVSDAVNFVAAQQQPSGNPASCVVAPTNPNPQTANLATSTAVTLTFTFNATCCTNSFANPYNAAADRPDLPGHADRHRAPHHRGGQKPNSATIPVPVWQKLAFNPNFISIISSSAGPSDAAVVLERQQHCGGQLSDERDSVPGWDPLRDVPGDQHPGEQRDRPGVHHDAEAGVHDRQQHPCCRTGRRPAPSGSRSV